MKYLSDYTEQATSKLLEDNGAFFAFSDKQFEEQKEKNKTKKDYTHIFGGLIVPKENAKIVATELPNITNQGIKKDIEENGITNIIKRELSNHEAYYTGDIEDTADTLKQYGITPEQILEVFHANRQIRTTGNDILIKQ
jgi:hypothetical protein